jgi:nucleotide-binding universal stress UspA family protein
MKPIMLATDGSPTAEKATETAIELSRALGAELVVVTVWEIPYTTVGLAPAPVETRTVVLRGITVQEICAAADKFDPRMVVVGSHGWGIVRRALFGSVSTGVLHHAKCPVLVIRGTDAPAAQNGSVEHAHAEH